MTGNLKFGVDLVTFCDPAFWGVVDFAAIVALAQTQPVAFWDRLLDGVKASGITGIEMTFPPFDWKGAVAAYGSQDGFAAALSERGLGLCSGFYAGLALGDDLTDPDTADRIVTEAVAYARFLRTCGAEVMVAGLPMRQTPGQAPVIPWDLARASALASLINRIGIATAAEGVKFALHTEAHSVFCMARDIDLMLMLTDPVYVHFCPDTAHLMLTGGDPLAIIDRHHERMVIAHWKDALGPMPADTPIDHTIHDRHRPYFCGFGLGRVDWPGFMRLQQRRAFAGWAILELDAAPDPIADLQRGLTFVRQALLPVYH